MNALRMREIGLGGSMVVIAAVLAAFSASSLPGISLLLPGRCSGCSKGTITQEECMLSRTPVRMIDENGFRNPLEIAALHELVIKHRSAYHSSSKAVPNRLWRSRHILNAG